MRSYLILFEVASATSTITCPIPRPGRIVQVALSYAASYGAGSAYVRTVSLYLTSAPGSSLVQVDGGVLAVLTAMADATAAQKEGHDNIVMLHNLQVQGGQVLSLSHGITGVVMYTTAQVWIE